MGLSIETILPYSTPNHEGFIVSPVDSMWEYIWWKFDVPNRTLYVDQLELTPLIDYVERIDELTGFIEAWQPAKIWVYVPDDAPDTFKRFQVLRRLIPEAFRDIVESHYEWDIFNAPQGVSFHGDQIY
ncbi:unnamed protein product [Calypogeia fissa]